MRLDLVVIGAIALLVGILLGWVPGASGGAGPATPTAPLVIQLPTGIGPVPVDISWWDLSANSQIHVAYCPSGVQPPASACPRFNLVGADNASSGSFDVNIPAGTQVVVNVTGPAGTSTQVTVSAGYPTLGVVIIVAGGTMVGVGVSMKRRPSKPEDSPDPNKHLASGRSSGAPPVVPRDSGPRL